MSNFVYDNVALPDAKTDKVAPTDPTRQWSAEDANAVFSAIDGIRDTLIGRDVNVIAYGAVGNGVVDDALAIQTAINAVASTVNGTFGGWVVIPRGTFILGTPLNIPNGVGLRGAGSSATTLKAKSSLSNTSLIRNSSQDGTQEYLFLEGLLIDGNRGGGAVFSTAVVDVVSLFINSYIRNVTILGGSNVGLRIAATNAMGPVYVANTWVLNNTGHNVLIEETVANTQAANGIICVNLTSEHQGTGKSAIYLKGLGHCQGWQFLNTHIEMGGADTGRTGITVDGVSYVLIDSVQLLTSGGVSQGILVTNVAQNVGIQIRNVTNSNVINPVLLDQKNSVTVGGVNLPWYVTPEVNVRGGLRFTPDTAAGARSLVAQSSAGVDRAWFDQNAALTGASLNGAGVDIKGDDTNNRPLVFVPSTVSGLTNIYGFLFPGGGGGVLRFRSLTGAQDVFQIGTDGTMFIYQPMTLQLLLTLQSGIRGSATAIPSTGTHVQGEIVFANNAAAGGFAGWYCTTGGSPGTWKTFGAISP